MFHTHKIDCRAEGVYPLEGKEYRSSKKGCIRVIFFYRLAWGNKIPHEYMKYTNSTQKAKWKLSLLISIATSHLEI